MATASACAAKSPVAGGADEARAPVSRNRDLITQADLSADPSTLSQSVLEVVRNLRPHFLNDHGSNALGASGISDPEAGKVHASVDNGRIVSVSELSGMHANQVIEIRYLNAGQAMQRFGSAARQGPVILVTTTVK
jgi:hypothetical protein